MQFCNDCISPCPTGAIDNWRQVDKAKPYTLAEQLGWNSLPHDVCRAHDMDWEQLRIALRRQGRYHIETY